MIKETNYTNVNHLVLLMGRPQTKVRDKLYHKIRHENPDMTCKIMNYGLKWIMKI